MERLGLALGVIPGKPVPPPLPRPFKHLIPSVALLPACDNRGLQRGRRQGSQERTKKEVSGVAICSAVL